MTSDRARECWRARQARLAELRTQEMPAAAVLDFYSKVLRFQADVASVAARKFTEDSPFRDQIDLDVAIAKLPALLEITIGSGPEFLAGRAVALRSAGEAEWRKLLRAVIAEHAQALDETSVFFARGSLQPIAEHLQLQIADDALYTGGSCPVCAAPPQASVLRPEGEGARRSLLCSFCLREWTFRRVVCPSCGEQDKEKLPHYSSDQFRHVRIEACDSCRRYVKAVDLSVDGRAVPLVDEVGASVLDVWASEHGYAKLVLNLMGL